MFRDAFMPASFQSPPVDFITHSINLQEAPEQAPQPQAEDELNVQAIDAIFGPYENDLGAQPPSSPALSLFAGGDWLDMEISDVSSEGEQQPQTVPAPSLSTPPPMETLEASPEIIDQNPPPIASLEAATDPVIPSLLDLDLSSLSLPLPLGSPGRALQEVREDVRRERESGRTEVETENTTVDNGAETIRKISECCTLSDGRSYSLSVLEITKGGLTVRGEIEKEEE